ncbi:MAG: hypothetical protein JST92_03555, partial [Deltaproteobacteria bacterium]|nr:hypothetical protein [Deltaproteobacteria bacterium]
MVTFATPLVAVLLAAGGVPQWADPGQPGFYVVAHMCNNAASVDWAISQGANGIENDIRFDAKTGQPTEFRHGGTCDCVCNPVPSSMNVCKVLNGDCEAREAAYAHLQRLGKLPWLSLMILDSKIPDTGAFNAAEAGKAIVKLCDIHLFGFQFKGKVIISNGKRTANGVAYIKAVAAAVAKSPNKDHYYVGFDQDSDLAATGALASQWSKHVIAGAGISACAPGAYTKE